MFCEYQIVPNALCPDYYIMIEIDTKLNNETDELSLLANGTTIIIPPKGKSYMYYPPRTDLYLIFESGEPLLPISKNDKTFSGMVDSIKPPNFTKINLDQENPKYLLWLNDTKKGDAITVCTTDGILEIFVSKEWYAVYGENEEDYYLKQYQLFDGSDMMKSFVGT
uniref:Uncharacterized protein n=1 Tax=Panagrolaimus davidi TaxID=227884 RepID=A0A914R671_9BILA